MPTTTTPADPGPAPLLLTPRDAARVLALSPRSLWALTHPRGPIPAVRIGRSVRYDVQALREYIAAQQERARP
jgi:excisionase family DNA binding protein